jgi:hypothetical protein
MQKTTERSTQVVRETYPKNDPLPLLTAKFR